MRIWFVPHLAQNGFPFNENNVRTIDGSDRADQLGKAHEILARIVPATYPDGTGETIDSTYNPRTISNIVSAQSETILGERSLSAMVWQFGQLLDHDVGLTESGPAFGTAPVPLTSNTDLFVQAGCTQVEFSRSDFTIRNSVREQPNVVT